MIRGSFWRSEPAAALRGLAKTGLPASGSDSLSRSKRRDGEEDLTAHLDQLGHRELVGAAQPARHGVDGAHVRRDVLAGRAVAAGQGADQEAVLVEQVDREAVDLELARRSSGASMPSRPSRAYHDSSSSTEKALSRLSIRRRWSTAVNSVETAPPTFWVGESGVRSSGNSSSRASRARSRWSKSASESVGRVQDVVAPARVLDLLAEPAVLLAGLLGGGRRLGHAPVLPPSSDTRPAPLGTRATSGLDHREDGREQLRGTRAVVDETKRFRFICVDRHRRSDDPARGSRAAAPRRGRPRARRSSPPPWRSSPTSATTASPWTPWRAAAKASKATLYRRWTNKVSLVIDAVANAKGPQQVPDTGSLQG